MSPVVKLEAGVDGDVLFLSAYDLEETVSMLLVVILK